MTHAYVVSESDLLTAGIRPQATRPTAAGLMTRPAVTIGPDEQIRREVTQDVIMDGFFLDPAPFTVTVKDGIVTLAGAIGSVVLGRNIADQAGRVEGVVAVRDRLTYPAPRRRTNA
jgi:osmotically-inducible protein OsmY